jgi:hypothetical protein
VSLGLQLVIVGLCLCLLFLCVANLAAVVELVNYDLLDVGLIEFWVRLDAQHRVGDPPNFDLTALRTGK